MKTPIKINKAVLLLFFAILTFQNINAQKRLAVYQMSVNRSGSTSLFSLAVGAKGNNNKSKMQIVPQKIISYFSSDPDFIIIDRKNQQLLENEKDLQKSENFIDGYIVEQGKAEGVDLICTSFYDESSKLLVIKIFDVAAEELFCSRERKLKSHWLTGVKALENEVTIMLHEISSECFDKGFPVVRVTKEKKGKAKEILVLAGYAQKIKLDYRMEIIKKVEEKIGDKTITRKEMVGEAIVTRIEDDNFSTLTIIKGKKEIYDALKEGIELQCKLINKK